MARSATTYTRLTGHHYMDVPINPETLQSGQLERRFNLAKFPQVGTRMTVTTTTALAITPASPATAATTLTFTATVTASETDGPLSGTVQFMNGATALGTPVAVSGGSASRTGTLPVGTHNITAVYSGGGEYGPSTSPVVTRSAT